MKTVHIHDLINAARIQALSGNPVCPPEYAAFEGFFWREVTIALIDTYREKRGRDMRRAAKNGIGWHIEMMTPIGWTRCSPTHATRDEAATVLHSYKKYGPDQEFRIAETLEDVGDYDGLRI